MISRTQEIKKKSVIIIHLNCQVKEKSKACFFKVVIPLFRN